MQWARGRENQCGFQAQVVATRSDAHAFSIPRQDTDTIIFFERPKAHISDLPARDSYIFLFGHGNIEKPHEDAADLGNQASRRAQSVYEDSAGWKLHDVVYVD